MQLQQAGVEIQMSMHYASVLSAAKLGEASDAPCRRQAHVCQATQHGWRTHHCTLYRQLKVVDSSGLKATQAGAPCICSNTAAC